MATKNQTIRKAGIVSRRMDFWGFIARYALSTYFNAKGHWSQCRIERDDLLKEAGQMRDVKPEDIFEEQD